MSAGDFLMRLFSHGELVWGGVHLAGSVTNGSFRDLAGRTLSARPFDGEFVESHSGVVPFGRKTRAL